MFAFLLRRVGAALIVLLLSSILLFLGVRALPGDPATALGAENRDPAVMKAIRHEYGLDKPIPVQYVKWLGQTLQGNLGRDQRDLAVSQTIVQRLPITLELAFLAIIVGIAIGIPAGIIAAVKQRKSADYVATTGALVGLSIPHFWLALMLISFFAVHLHWLPALVLGTGLSAVLMRQMRSSMLSSLGADYVRTARAKGLPERTVILKHALRNSLITVTTIIGVQLGIL